jgi:hypothetical protein
MELVILEHHYWGVDEREINLYDYRSGKGKHRKVITCPKRELAPGRREGRARQLKRQSGVLRKRMKRGRVWRLLLFTISSLI